jgi:ubiquinone biosynthesis protein UbiJ
MANNPPPDLAPMKQTSEQIRRAAAELMDDAKRIIDRSRALRMQADELDRLAKEKRRLGGNKKSK